MLVGASSLGAWPDPPAIRRLSEINVPTLIVVGDSDMADIYQITDLLESRIPGASRQTIPDAAHMVNMEQPVDFNEIVLDFLLHL